MNLNKQKLERLHSLYNDSNVPLNMISKRLHIPYSRVRKIIKENVNDPTLAFSHYKQQTKFKKIHERVHNKIVELMNSSTSLITVPSLNKELKHQLGTNIKNKMLRLYLKERLGATYRHIKQIGSNHNSLSSKL